MRDDPLNVLFVCSGVGIMNRGIESFFREAFDGLHGTPGLGITLLKGAGDDADDEKRIWCLPRTGPIASTLGRLTRRNGYVIEQLSSLPGIIRQIRRLRPQVVFYSDVNMAMRLLAKRKRIGIPFKLVFSNGGPADPPFDGCDHVQQVAPFYYDAALAAGEDPAKHSMVPYGINVPPGEPWIDPAAKKELRRKLNLPTDRPIVLSVGWIAARHKRMDYTITELARLPAPRPYLVMLGAIDAESPAIIQLATDQLGPENFTARSVPYDQVPQYYQAADVFMLSSLREGFGRVYLESLIAGLPAIAHDHPVMRFVLGDVGTLADLSIPGEGAKCLIKHLASPNNPAAMAHRREDVRRRFSWPVLAPQYRQMFRRAIQPP